MDIGSARASRRMARPAQRTGLGCGVAIITGAIVLVVIVLAAFAIFSLVPRGGPSTSAVVQTQPGALAWDPAQPTTVLLVERAHGSGAAATSLSVLSYDPAQRRLSLLAIPANLWVTVPGFGQAALGQAYADGGIRLLLLTVQSALARPIEYYAIADAHTLAQIIDAFGGVSVTVPDRTALGSRTVGPGRVHLSGADTEAYVAAGPSVGALASQSALLALLRQVQTPDNRIRLPSVLNSLGAAVATNFPLDQVPALLSALGRLKSDRIMGAALDPESGTTIPYVSAGMRVLLPQWERIHALARHLEADPALSGPVEVLNGSGVPGQAAALAAWLRSAAVPVKGYATAPSGSNARTRVIIGPAANRAERTVAQTVATLLQVPVAIGAVAGHHNPVILIIGRDFQNPAQQ